MIETKDLTVAVGQFELRGISFFVPQGRYAVLMGKTGSGKTTLLESVCGLKRVVSGNIMLDGRDVTALPPAQRNIGLVPQDGALFTTMTVKQHIEFALVIRHWSSEQRNLRCKELAHMLHLEDLLDRYPDQLSGGERQRVALGRALSFRPSILCLDEPLSALDDDTRDEMISLLKRVQRETGVTALHVTHNRHEAEALADVRLHIENGILKEDLPPIALTLPSDKSSVPADSTIES